MYSTVARISASDALEPPLGGMAFLPLMAFCTSTGRPCAMRAAQAALSPNFGAPAMPVAWQVAQVCLNSASPDPAAAPAAAVCGAAAAGGVAAAAGAAAAGAAA